MNGPQLSGLLSSETRARLRSLATRPAALLLSFGLTANGATLIGFLICALAGLAVALGAPLLGALLFALGTLADGLDGTMARLAGRANPFGAYYDSLLDRAGEAAIFTGIAVGASAGVLGEEPTALVLLAVLALGSGFLVSYARARAEGLGVAIGEQGLMQRGERAGLLFLTLLVGGLIAPIFFRVGLALLALLSGFTVIQRIRAVRRVLAATEIPGTTRR